MSTHLTLKSGLRPLEGTTQKGSDGLLAVCWRQWRAERALKARGIDFRTTEPSAALEAYSSMTSDEFAAINGRQAWANRRTIARSLRGLLPGRALLVLDLGCGTGESTRVLASLLPAGSQVIGIEFASRLVELAREHDVARRDVAVQFIVGSVTETYRDGAGGALPDESVDVVNASGIFGHHLDGPDAEAAANEIARVLKVAGIAAIDVGPRLSASDLKRLMKARGFTPIRRTRSNPFDRTGQVVFRKC